MKSLSYYEQLLFDEHGLEVTLKAFEEDEMEMVQVKPWPLALDRDGLDDPMIRKWVANKIKREGELREV